MLADAFRETLKIVVSKDFLKETLHKMQPIALSYGYYVAVSYIVVCILWMTPVGVIIMTEALWTTLLSPILLFAYPYNIYKIWIDDAAPCDRSIVDMVQNKEDYTNYDFMETLGYKENRIIGPLMLVAYSAANLQWTLWFPGVNLLPKWPFKIIGQLLSLVRIPFLWASWVLLTPSYLINVVINIVIGLNFWVLTKNNVTSFAVIEPYVYDTMGSSCLLDTYKCPELYLNYN